jgi:thermitase
VLVVGYKSGTTDASKDNQQGRRSSRREKRLTSINVDVVDLPPGTDVQSAAAQFRADPEVAYAEPDYVAHVDAFAPNDTLYSQQYGPQKIGAVAAHNIVYPGGYTPLSGGNPTTITSPVIAVIDTGIAANAADPTANPDLVHKVLATAVNCTLTATGLTQPCPTSAPFDDNGHGTHVAGIAAAETNNAAGIVGIAPNAQLLSIKALDSTGSGYYSWISSAILCAADYSRCGLGTGHAAVINMSLGGGSASSMMQNAINTARAAGVVVVAAAGNSGSTTLSYPGAYADLSVIATDQSDARPSWSNYGGYANQVSAPGVDILSTVSKNTALSISAASGYATLSGTSMATPHVSGLAALLTGLVPASNIPTRIKQTARKLPNATSPDTVHFGAGRIDALAAVTGTTPPPPAPDFSVSVSPTSRTVSRGTNPTYTVTAKRLNGFNSALTPTVAGLPTGTTATITATTTPDQWKVKLHTTAKTPLATFTLTFTVAGGGKTHSVSATLTVT